MLTSYPPTIIIRHRKENLKKCSLTGLEIRPDFLFYTYPLKEIPPFENYILLSLDAEQELSYEDSYRGLLLIDATWRYAEKMTNNIPMPKSIVKRGLPKNLKTAYPRRQDIEEGLASIEALIFAYAKLGRDMSSLLKHYYWGKAFMDLNQTSLLQDFKTPSTIHN